MLLFVLQQSGQRLTLLRIHTSSQLRLEAPDILASYELLHRRIPRELNLNKPPAESVPTPYFIMD